MKEFAAFVKKEFRHILRDKRTILIVLIMPVVQMILFGYAVRTEIEHARVDVVGDMADPAVRKIVDRIDKQVSGHKRDTSFHRADSLQVPEERG